MVSLGIKIDKSLIYKVVSLINQRSIVLIIILTIVPMNDWEKEFTQKSVSTLVLIAI